jgi:hypothetical protein
MSVENATPNTENADLNVRVVFTQMMRFRTLGIRQNDRKGTTSETGEGIASMS